MKKITGRFYVFTPPKLFYCPVFFTSDTRLQKQIALQYLTIEDGTQRGAENMAIAFSYRSRLINLSLN
jgi:hypothetical protein